MSTDTTHATTWLTVDEAGAELGLSRAQMYRRIERQQLEATRARRDGKSCYLISADSVRRYSSQELDLSPAGSPDMLRVCEVASMLGFSSEQVRGMVRRGWLAAHRSAPKGTWRIPRSAVEDYLEDSRK